MRNDYVLPALTLIKNEFRDLAHKTSAVISAIRKPTHKLTIIIKIIISIIVLRAEDATVQNKILALESIRDVRCSGITYFLG